MAIKASIEVEVGTLTLEAEAETQALIKASVHLIPHLNSPQYQQQQQNSSTTQSPQATRMRAFKARMRDLHARSVGRWDTMLLTVTIG
jgi:hypothetical protein